MTVRNNPLRRYSLLCVGTSLVSAFLVLAAFSIPAEAFAVAAIPLDAVALPSAAPTALAASTTLAPAHQAQRAILGATDHTVFQRVGTVRLNGVLQPTFCWTDTTMQRSIGFNRTSGTQIPTNAKCIGTFTQMDGVSADNQEWFEYKSVQSKFCAKLDPGISGDPVVSFACETGTSTNTEREEHWNGPPKMFSLYNATFALCIGSPTLTRLNACNTTADSFTGP